MAGKTISEKILSAKSGTSASSGDVVICEADRLLACRLVLGRNRSTRLLATRRASFGVGSAGADQDQAQDRAVTLDEGESGNVLEDLREVSSV